VFGQAAADPIDETCVLREVEGMRGIATKQLGAGRFHSLALTAAEQVTHFVLKNRMNREKQH